MITGTTKTMLSVARLALLGGVSFAALSLSMSAAHADDTTSLDSFSTPIVANAVPNQAALQFSNGNQQTTVGTSVVTSVDGLTTEAGFSTVDATTNQMVSITPNTGLQLGTSLGVAATTLSTDGSASFAAGNAQISKAGDASFVSVTAGGITAATQTKIDSSGNLTAGSSTTTTTNGTFTANGDANFSTTAAKTTNFGTTSQTTIDLTGKITTSTQAAFNGGATFGAATISSVGDASFASVTVASLNKGVAYIDGAGTLQSTTAFTTATTGVTSINITNNITSGGTILGAVLTDGAGTTITGGTVTASQGATFGNGANSLEISSTGALTNGLTVSTGGANITGDTSITGNLGVSGNYLTTNGNITTTNGTVSAKTAVVGTGGLSVAGTTTTNGITNTGLLNQNGIATFTNGPVATNGSTVVSGGLITVNSKTVGEFIIIDANTDPVLTVTNGTVAGTTKIDNGAVTIGASVTAPTGNFTTANVGTANIATSLNVSNGANVNLGNNVVHGVADPVVGTDAANKAYVDRGVNKAYEGTAIALAISQPLLVNDQSFAIRGGWGTYENQNAFGVSAAGVIARGVFGNGSTVVVDAGVGFGTDHNDVAGKAGVTIGFGGGYAPLK